MNGTYNDFFQTEPVQTVAKSSDAFIWIVLSIVIAIVGGIALYFAFLDKNNENKVDGIWKKIYDFFNFKTLYSKELLKMLYIILTIGMNLLLIVSLFDNFFITVLVLFFGNVLIRIGYELLLKFINLCDNISEINTKLNLNKDKFKNKKYDNYNTKKENKKEEN